MGNAQLVKQYIGKTVPVGKYKVQLVKLLAEGGFGYVFLVKDTSTGQHMALKRLLVSEEDTLRKVILEVEFMKKLSPHKNIVRYFDTCTNNMKNGEKEILILMEYCSGGLVEHMNHRMNNRFTEKEIWDIFSDVCEGLTQMHIQDPPIAHRDLKVENVLLGDSGERKLCDFGSATTRVYRCSNNKREKAEAEEDISKNTTLTYRAPEMVDLYSNKDISEKVDIWALGVLLYKLAYFTTPFEMDGALGIVNAKFDFPNSPTYSQSLRNMISYLLNPNPDTRPNIFDVMEQFAKITGVSLPSLKKRPQKRQVIKDTPKESPQEETFPATASPNSPTSGRKVRIAEPTSNLPATTVSFSTAESIQALPKPELRSPNATRRRPAKSEHLGEGAYDINPQHRYSSSSIPPLKSPHNQPTLSKSGPITFEADFSSNFQNQVNISPPAPNPQPQAQPPSTTNNPFLNPQPSTFNTPFDFDAFNTNTTNKTSNSSNSNNPFEEPTPAPSQPSQTPPIVIQNNPFLSSVTASQNPKHHVHFNNPAPTPYHTPEASPRITPEVSPATSPSLAKGILTQHRRNPSGDIILAPPPSAKESAFTHRRSQSAHYRSMPASSDPFTLLNNQTKTEVPNIMPPPPNQQKQRGHRGLGSKSQSVGGGLTASVNVQDINL